MKMAISLVLIFAGLLLKSGMATSKPLSDVGTVTLEGLVNVAKIKSAVTSQSVKHLHSFLVSGRTYRLK